MAPSDAVSTISGDPNSSPFEGGRPIGWGWVLFYGAMLLLVGLLVIANPMVTGFAMGILLSVVLCIYGVAAIVAGLTTLSERARWVEVLLGLIALAAGIAVLFNPMAGAITLVWTTGVWLIIAGAFELILGFRSRFDRGWRLFMGVLDVVLGGMLLFASPATSIAFLAIVVAITFFTRGVFMIVLALGLRKISHRLHG